MRSSGVPGARASTTARTAGSHLLVGVRDGHDARPLDVHHREWIRPVRRLGLRAGQPSDRPHRPPRRRRRPRTCRRPRRARSSRPGSRNNPAPWRVSLSGRYTTNPPEPGDRARAEADHLYGRVEQVLLVVPRGSESPVRLAVQPHHVAGSSALRLPRRRAPRRTGRAARGTPRRAPSRWPGGCAPARRPRDPLPSAARSAAPTTGLETGSSPLAGQSGRSEQLAQPVHGEERHCGHTGTPRARPARRARGESSPCRDADLVGGDDDGDRGERVVALRGADLGRQRRHGGSAEGHPLRSDTAHRSRSVDPRCDRIAARSPTPTRPARATRPGRCRPLCR